MIGATRRWLRRKRGPIAIGVGVIGAGYLAGQYVLSKISEARERMASERTARENIHLNPPGSLRRRFEQNQADCTFTTLGLLYTATEQIYEALPVEQLTQELQQKKTRRLSRKSIGAASTKSADGAGSVNGDATAAADEHETETGQAGDAAEPQPQPQSRSQSLSRRGSHAEGASASADGSGELAKPTKSRTQLWNELKIISLTRSFVLLYTLTLLTLLTRIQLNLLGRRSYLASVVALTRQSRAPTGISLEDHADEATYLPSPAPRRGDGDGDGDGGDSQPSDLETDKQYLAFSWWLLHHGWRDIMAAVKEAVTDVFGPISPREEISQDKLSALTREVRRRIEGATGEERLAKRWLPLLLPPPEKEAYVLRQAGVLVRDEGEEIGEDTAAAEILRDGSLLRRLLDETSDLIDSPPFAQIAVALNDEGFSALIDRHCALEIFHSRRPTAFDERAQHPHSESSMSMPAASGTLSPSSSSLSSTSPAQPVQHPLGIGSQCKVKFANILAIISRQAHVIANSTEPPNEYLATMEENVRDLEAFAAVIYSNNLSLDDQQREELLRLNRVSPEPEPEPGSESEAEAEVGTSAAQRGTASFMRFLNSQTAGLGGDAAGDGDDDDAVKAFNEIWGRAAASHSLR
ncbi:peroxin [Ascosphaera acerosa]|nr:peroxin [Ascosphaera acerosa]